MSDNTPQGSPDVPAVPPVPPTPPAPAAPADTAAQGYPGYATPTEGSAYQQPAAAPEQPAYGQPAPPAYGQPAAPPYGQQPAYAQQPYGYAQPAAAPYGYPAPVKTNALALTSLISAIAAFVVLPFIASIVAVITGHIALKQLKTSGENGRGLALGGTIVGWVGIGLGILGIIAVILWFTFIFSIASSSGYSYS